MAEARLKLFLHAGTNKTGTTSLQNAWHAYRSQLLTRGILYPDVEINPGPVPKHQWLTDLVLAEDLAGFRRNVAAVATAAKSANASRVILSSEGLFNHWFDFSAVGKAALATLSESFDVTVWVVFREPVSWAVSSYIQAVKNPPFHLAPLYSTVEPLESLIDQEYYATRLQYARFVQEAERVFGEGTVHAMQYEARDIVEQARGYLGVDAAALASAGDKNRALSVLGLELMLRLNRMRIAGEERQRLASLIVELDQTLGATSEPVRPSPEVRSKVLAISRESETYLRQRFGIGWDHSR